MARIAIRPLKQEAVLQANDEFYRNNPEMIDNGKRIPIDPCNPKHAKYQKEWMDSYVKNGGKTRNGQYKAKCGQAKMKCPCQGILEVLLVESNEKKNPVSGVNVTIYGLIEGNKKTDADGRAIFSGLEAGSYQVEAILQNSLSYQGIVDVSCETTKGIRFEVDVQKMIRVPWRWIQDEHMNPVDKPFQVGQVIKIKTIRNIVLEWKKVPEDFAMESETVKNLDFGYWGIGGTFTFTLHEGKYRKPTALDIVESIGWGGMKVLGVLVGSNPDLVADTWIDGWNNYKGESLNKYRNKTWSELLKMAH